jgi:hypothetical protein
MAGSAWDPVTGVLVTALKRPQKEGARRGVPSTSILIAIRLNIRIEASTSTTCRALCPSFLRRRKSRVRTPDQVRGESSICGKCQEFFPNYPENPLFEKSRFSGPFRQKRLSYSEITLMIFRTLPVMPGCNKVLRK